MKKGEQKGIPKEIMDDLNVRKKKGEKDYEVAVSVSEHQAKVSIPKIIVMELGLLKNQKCKLSYNKKRKEIICKF